MITVDPDCLDYKCESAEEAVAVVHTLQDLGADKLDKKVQELLAREPALRAIVSDKSLSRHQRKLRAFPIFSRLMRQHHDEKRELEAKLRHSKSELARCDAIIEGSKALEEWAKIPPKLEKNDCSRLHRLIAAFKQNQVIFLGDKKGETGHSEQETAAYLFTECHPFVVQNDWASAFQNATDYAEGGIKLPFPICAFEFRISGKNVIVWTAQMEDEDPAATAFIEVDGHWFGREEKARDDDALQFAWMQIRAICIALDAEVASRNVVRAPFKLNKARERDGKVPLRDYHIVSLTRRMRTTGPVMAGSSQGTRKRLHFRRGHWRHYEQSKTWIRWTLVGNPDLGWIDHEYRL